MEYKNLVSEFVKSCIRILGENLTGVYLHGSMAMGCFNPLLSDIDMIVVVEGAINDGQKLCLMKEIVRLNRNAPAKGLEISFVQRKFCKPFVYPTPFELHFSPDHLQWFYHDPQGYIERMKGEDKDLAAHFTIINHYGIRLYGEEIEKIFASVPKKDYADSILYDIENAAEAVLENPVYVILNLCRALAYFKNDLILSKEEGGKWALSHVEREFSSVVEKALLAYRTSGALQIDQNLAVRLAKNALQAIESESGIF